MGQAPTPKKLVINCDWRCNLHPDKIGEGKAETLKAIREAGAGIRPFMVRGSELVGFPITFGAAQRHLSRHYRELEDAPEAAGPPGAKSSDLEILESIIAAGHRNSRSWKPSISDTLKAMEMKLRLTGNSAFEDMLDAIAAASSGEEGLEGYVPPESIEAVLSAGEMPVDDDEVDLPDPVF